jgi:hypothetical protein
LPLRALTNSPQGLLFREPDDGLGAGDVLHRNFDRIAVTDRVEDRAVLDLQVFDCLPDLDRVVASAAILAAFASIGYSIFNMPTGRDLQTRPARVATQQVISFSEPRNHGSQVID